MSTTKSYSRSVSIIGVGCTPFMFALDNPETAGLTENEFFGYAAIEAMRDAGVEAKDIDAYFHGQASPYNGSNYITPNMQVADWFGMRGKPSYHHSEACCTGYIALDLAVQSVASGKYDMVLTGCVDLADSVPVPGMPANHRTKFTLDMFQASKEWIFDRAYTRSFIAGTLMIDDPASIYAREHSLSDDQMDDILNQMAINNRLNAVKNPLAIHKLTYDEQAKQAGFETAMDFLRSPYNPKITDYFRVSSVETKCDGAAAVIVCPTEMAYQYTDHPIEVLGYGNAAYEAANPHIETRGTKEALEALYKMVDVSPSEIDLFYANDFFIVSHLIAAELAGYLPKGEGWKYIMEGRTTYDGDRPINTNGGRTSFGHAHAASGLADVYEAVKQIRGLCGERQVKGNPKTAMLRGFGGGQNLTATIIRSL